jgi:hypothetical protein
MHFSFRMHKEADLTKLAWTARQLLNGMILPSGSSLVVVHLQSVELEKGLSHGGHETVPAHNDYTSWSAEDTQECHTDLNEYT